MPKTDKSKKSRAASMEKIEEDAVRKKLRITWKEITLLAIVAALAILLAVFIITGGGKIGQGVKPVSVGMNAPEFRLPTIDGKLAGLSDYRGKVVMVHFWATWCPPCVDEIPSLERLYKMLSDKDFEIFGVSVDEGGIGIMSSFIQRHGVTFPVLLDPQRSIPTLYGTFKFPESYIIDREGVVREKIIGSRDWNDPSNVSIISELLGNR